MNFFENELRKIVALGVPFSDPKFTGGACYGKLDGQLRIKLEFAPIGAFQHYDGIKATVINRSDGPVDSTVFKFSDLLGAKRTSKPKFSNGVTPFARTYDGKTDWYDYRPTEKHYRQLCNAINDYCGVFQEQEQGQGLHMSQQL